MDALEVFKSPFEKFRLGNKGDGGYIICDIPGEYDMLLSGGVNDDISFEEAFLDKYPGVPCLAYDGTIETFPVSRHPIQFVKKNIDQNNNLHEIVNRYSNIFVKMDIERWEYPWIYSLSHEQLARMKQIVIEFHFPDEDPYNRWSIIGKLKKTHKLVHIHGNNACDVNVRPDGTIVPHVFECTYIRHEGDLLRNIHQFPIELDHKNDESKPDVVLKGYPYTL